MSIELKIKSKHLAEEPRIIRHEEQKLRRQLAWNRRENGIPNDTYREMYKFNSLVRHRKWDVRNEARATNLARAHIAGKTYKETEPHCSDPYMRNHYILPRVVKMVQKYHDRSVTRENILEWMK